MLPDALWRVMLRSILRRPLQSLMFVAGVALGVAMIVGIDLANSSAGRAFGIFTESLAGRTTHQIIGGPDGLPDTLYRRLRVDMSLRQTAPVVTAYVQAIEMDEQPLRVLGIDPFAEGPFRGYLNLGAGSNASTQDLTRFLTQPDTVLMAEPLAKTYGLKQGDSLTLRYGPKRHTVTIVGLLRPADEVTSQGLQDMLIADVSTAQELLGMVGRLSTIDLIVPDGAEGTALLDKIRSMLPPGAVIQPAAARSTAIGQMTQAFDLSLTALSLLALVVGMFLIYNTVTFSVVQRRPILGVLRALGVTRRQIFGMILLEAALLSVIGALIGLGVGILAGRAAVVLVTRTVSSLYFTVNVRGVDVPTLSLLKGALVGVGSALLAALLPALEATTTPPAGTLKRSDIESKVRRLVPAVTAVGLVIIGLSLAALSVNALTISFAGLFGIVIGFSLLTPLVALSLMRLIRPLSGKLLGVLGLMAPRSIIRALSRTSVAVAALMVAVSVIVGVSAMVGSFRSDVQYWLENTIRADILISPPSIQATRQDVPVDPAVADVVRQIPGVEIVGVSRSVDAVRPGDALPVHITAIDVDISQGHRLFVWNIGNYDAVWAAMAQGAVIVSETFAHQRQIPIGPGQTITLVTDKGEHTFPIVGVMTDYSGDQGTVMMRMPIYRSLYNDQFISTLGLFLRPGADLESVIRELKAKFAGQQELIVSSNRELRASVLVIFDQTFAITTALNLLATVVAFIGILSALAALQLERTRELGTLRANGLTRGQLFRLTLVEADGSTTHLNVSDYTITPLGHWTSPHTGAVYPSGWRLTIKMPTGPIQLEVTPLMRDQELNTTTAYWEGASRITGTANDQSLTGYGYVELTGYNRPQTGW